MTKIETKLINMLHSVANGCVTPEFMCSELDLRIYKLSGWTIVVQMDDDGSFGHILMAFSPNGETWSMTKSSPIAELFSRPWYNIMVGDFMSAKDQQRSIACALGAGQAREYSLLFLRSIACALGARRNKLKTLKYLIERAAQIVKDFEKTRVVWVVNEHAWELYPIGAKAKESNCLGGVWERVRTGWRLENIVFKRPKVLPRVIFLVDTVLIHGKNCKKSAHSIEGLLHSSEDDTPFNDDNVKYCGRCHHAL